MTNTVPCKTCGAPTDFLGTRLCTGCWEVESRLPDYLKSARAQERLRECWPKLDDWTNGVPGWDYEAVLREHNVVVEWIDTLVDGNGNTFPAGDMAGWGLAWKGGYIAIAQTTEKIARQAAALFVSLWLRGVSASFADKLMDGYIEYLERQENQSLTLRAEIDYFSCGEPFFRLTRENLRTDESFPYGAEAKIITALGVQPDNEVLVTFTVRKKHGWKPNTSDTKSSQQTAGRESRAWRRGQESPTTDRT